MNKLLMTAVLAITVITGVVLVDTMLNPAKAAECSASHVAKCGVWSVAEMRGAYNGDTTPGLKNIFHGMGITGDMVNKSTVKEGTVGKDGKVIVNGEVVATNAESAGRTVMSHTTERVKREHGGTVYYSSATSDSFRSSKLDAFVFFDESGRFQSAVIKECGNPVKGTPTQPEKPPVEKPAKIKVCELKTMKYPVWIDEDKFDDNKHSMEADDCKEEEKPKTMVVCVLETKEYPKTIDQSDFDKSLHSKNANDCKEETPPVAELPQTGVADDLIGTLGIGSMVTAGIAYLASRRAL